MSKVSYKVTDDPRLQDVDFHGQVVRPLYFKLVHARKSTTFKSVFFDQLTKPKHALHVGAAKKAPTIDQLLKKEQQVINFIVDKLGDSFSLPLFKEAYSYYTTDLIEVTEDLFNEFLRVYFTDEGVPSFARSLFEGNKTVDIYQVVDDLRICFKAESYAKLLDAAYNLAPPYLVLHSFARKIKKWPVILPVIEWGQKETQELFIQHVKDNFKKINPETALYEVDRYIKAISK